MNTTLLIINCLGKLRVGEYSPTDEDCDDIINCSESLLKFVGEYSPTDEDCDGTVHRVLAHALQ